CDTMGGWGNGSKWADAAGWMDKQTLLCSFSKFLHNWVLEKVHALFVESVPFRSIAIFTIIQIVYFLLCFGVTWIPVAGILFPVPFFLLISIRQHALPKLFQLHHLRELDAAEYEEIAGSPSRAPSFNPREIDLAIRVNDEGDVSICDAEILDELTTSRGELKLSEIVAFVVFESPLPSAPKASLSMEDFTPDVRAEISVLLLQMMDRYAECSSCKFLAEKIKTLEAKIKIQEGALEMERHLEKHTLDSAAILHELYNEMGKLSLE
nr:boron transporter 4-like [Tanacetum cinerariifolium]